MQNEVQYPFKSCPKKAALMGEGGGGGGSDGSALLFIDIEVTGCLKDSGLRTFNIDQPVRWFVLEWVEEVMMMMMMMMVVVEIMMRVNVIVSDDDDNGAGCDCDGDLNFNRR